MKKYSMLVIGFRCYGGHIREFVTNLKKKNPEVKITVAITLDSKDNMDEIIPCVDNIIQYKRRRAGRMESLSKGLYFYVQFIKLWLKGGFDIVDIHFANSAILPFMPLPSGACRRNVGPERPEHAVRRGPLTFFPSWAEVLPVPFRKDGHGRLAP